MTITDVATTTEAYVIPKPEMILKEEEAVAFIEKLETHPTAWVYVLTQVLSRPTPKEYIQDRAGPSKLKLFYVDGAYAIATRAALSRIGIGSDFEVVSVRRDEQGSSALGKLTFKFVHNNMVLTVSSGQGGECPKRSTMSWGDCDKGAITDCQKKCLSEFGWASDVYAMAPEKMSVEMSAEEAAAKSVEYVITAATEKGISPTELDEYVYEHYEGKKLTELEQPALTSLRRKIQSKDGLK